jgi:ubiquinone biosynthesis protein
MFKYDFFHADLHPRKYTISKNNFNNPVIILIDFGITGKMKKSEKLYLAKNLLAFSQQHYKKVAKLHLKAKTISTNKSISEIENELYFTFEPILNKI